MAEKLYSYADKQVMDEIGSGGGGGGQDGRKCVITVNSPTDVSCNMTFSELSEFLNEIDSNIIVKMNYSGYFDGLPCTKYAVRSESIGLQFVEVNTNTNNLNIYYVIVEPEGIEIGITRYNLSVVNP